MSLHARCPQRIASTSAYRTVWRQRCVRHYASDTASDSAWFQEVRTELLSRRPQFHHEDLDPLHHEQLYDTLVGFAPNYTKPDAGSRPHISLAELLTRFNVRVQSPKLLSDGTDPLHHPGEPWMRRMWAGGAVKLNPGLELGFLTPFRLKQKVTCLEHIKDVRLRGTGDETKIFVTIERRFASSAADPIQAEASQNNNFTRAIRDDDWSDSLVKEERSLVFMKAKTAAELEHIQTGQALGDTRYLKAPGSPEYSFALTPTRSLLFRYSAVTYNAHLLHLDPTYARSVEGHRNILVHGALTLTLMLQVLNKHLGLSQIAQGPEAITSIEYRNIAPLYCDEEMRLCVKHKKRSETGDLWDIWIEGPTGGMAVKAVAQTVGRPARAVDITGSESVKETSNTDLPDVQTVALQAQDRLHELDQEDSGLELLTRVSREEHRKLRRPEHRPALGQTQPEPSIPVRVYNEFSRGWREQRVGKALPYLYLEKTSPLFNPAEVARAQPVPSRAKRRSRRKEPAPVPRTAFSARWRRQQVGKALPYLYLYPTSPLIVRTGVPGAPSASPAPKRPLRIRTIKIDGPAHVAPLSNTQSATGKVKPEVRVRKIEGITIRGIDIQLKEAERRRAHGKRQWHNDVLRAAQEGSPHGGK